MGELSTLRGLINKLSGYGTRPAVLALQKEGVDAWSYAALAEYVHQLALGLVKAGVGPDTHLALFAGNRPEWVVACLAAINAGGIAVPVDAQAGDETLTHILADSQARFIFTTSNQVDRLRGLKLDPQPELILLDRTVDQEYSWRRLTSDSGELPPVESEDQAVLFYTSGTTGPPKGVPLTHKNLVFQLEAIIAAQFVTKTDRVLVPLPLHHVYPFAFGMLAPLRLGLPVIMPRSLTGPQILRALSEGQATLILGVPRLYRVLYEGIETGARSSGALAAAVFRASFGLSLWLRRRLGVRLGKLLLRPLHRRFGPTLRVLASGGSALDPELAWKLEGLGWQVGIGYGLTETAPLLSLNAPGRARIGSVGRPLEGVEIWIDPSTQAAAPEQAAARRTRAPNVQGEIVAKGPNVFAGYRHLPQQTRQAFTPDGYFRTGDLGYFDKDGYLYITGRVSTVIVTESGKNIQPDEVEEAYLAHPLIAEIGVLQQEGRLVALIVPELSELRQRTGGEVEAAVREAVEIQARSLPSYQRIVDYAVTRETLPRTRLGKIRRHLLLDRYQQAKRGQEAPAESPRPVSIEEMESEDRTLLEESAAARQVWDWLAERYADRRLTPDTSPQLDLGVDSLEWLNLSLEINQRTGVELAEEAIVRVESVRDLLHEVAEAAEAGGIARGGISLERPEEALSPEQKHWVEPLGPVQVAAARLMYFLNWLLMRSLFRVSVEGLENLPVNGPYMITPNHRSYLDALVVAAALDQRRLRQTYWAGAAAVVFFNRVLRLVSRLSHTVPIESAGSSLAFGALILQRGHIMVWFPEGRRSLSGELEPFKPGIGILLNQVKVPVVPAYIHCSREALAPGSFRLRLQPITIVFGRSAQPGELEALGQGEQPHTRITTALRDRVVTLGRQSVRNRC